MIKHNNTYSYTGNIGRKRLKKYLLHGLLLFAVFCIGRVWLKVSVDQTMRQNQKLKADLTQMQYESYLLTLQFDNLTNVDRIERLAHERLGFVQAEKLNIDINAIEN